MLYKPIYESDCFPFLLVCDFAWMCSCRDIARTHFSSDSTFKGMEEGNKGEEETRGEETRGDKGGVKRGDKENENLNNKPF